MKIVKKIAIFGRRKICISRVGEKAESPFRLIGVDELWKTDDVVSCRTARSRAYRDAYDLIFLCNGERPINLCGDLTVTRSLINENYLALNREDGTIFRGDKELAEDLVGALYREDDGRKYQAQMRVSK